VPADLLRRRPDIRAAERAIAVASARIGVATADLYPSISIVGNTGFAAASLDNSRNSKMSDIFSADSFTGFIGLSVNWPILNYGRIENNIRATDARYEQALANYQQQVLSAAAEVESSLYTLLQRQQQAVALSESVDAAQRSADLAEIQYRNGAADFIRLNDAQATLFARQESLIATKTLATVSAINAYRALGGGWEIRGNAEFVDRDTAERMKARTNWGDVLGPNYSDGKDVGLIARPGDLPPTDQPVATPTTPNP
jgi:outer membrane protein TolC